jgi:SAM-dependent methyltransferase
MGTFQNEMIAAYTKQATDPKPDLVDAQRVDYGELGQLDLPDDIFAAACGGGCPLSFAPRPLDGKRVVDLGCGAGHDVVIAAKLGAGQVVGVDLTPAMLARAAQNAARCGVESNTFFVQGSLGALFEQDGEDGARPLLPAGLAEGAADLVISNGAFNLTLDKPAAFRAAFRLAAPGATFCLTDVCVDEAAVAAAKASGASGGEEPGCNEVPESEEGCGSGSGSGVGVLPSTD